MGALASAGPDRSGLPLLQRVVDAAAHRRNVHVRIVREQREEISGVYTADSVCEFWWRSGGSFRYDRSGMWGDGMLVVNDGRTAWVDTLDGSVAPEKREGITRFETAASAIAMLGSERSPLLDLFLGPDPVKALGEDGSVVEEAAEGPLRRVRLRGETVGDVELVIDSDHRVAEVRIQTAGGTRTREFVRYLEAPRPGTYTFDPPRVPTKGEGP